MGEGQIEEDIGNSSEDDTGGENFHRAASMENWFAKDGISGLTKEGQDKKEIGDESTHRDGFAGQDPGEQHHSDHSEATTPPAADRDPFAQENRGSNCRDQRVQGHQK